MALQVNKLMKRFLLRTTLPVLLVGGLCFSNLGGASQAQPIAKDPVLEAKVMDIAADLRCLVCQNESIAGSHADLAMDLRDQIRDQLVAGQSKKQILDYMVARYGDFVLYKPPVQSNTLFLWFAPFLLLILGLFVLVRFIGKPKALTQSSLDLEQDLHAARELLVNPSQSPQNQQKVSE
jgi:cytochrome c-type biogenesis protein CcmH